MIARRKGRCFALLAALTVCGLVGVGVWLYGADLRTEVLLWRRFERLGPNEHGYLEYRHRQTGIVFVRVPGGAFLMGSPEDEEGRRPEERRHEVRLNSFLIAKYEVTRAQWRSILGENPKLAPGGDDLPVNQVSWDDVAEFCRRSDLSLPTEAQWEYACRAGTTGAYAGTGRVEEMGRFDWARLGPGARRLPRAERVPNPIGSLRPNDFGLYDMHGNVVEWCLDVYDRNFYSTPAAVRTDPVCLAGDGSARVVRGGGCGAISPLHGRSAARYRIPSTSRPLWAGFRPAFYPLP